MNCIWILLLLCCGGNQNGCGGCNRNQSCCSNMNCGRARCTGNYKCGCQDTLQNTCETVCETICDRANDNMDQGCGCNKPFPYTSYPVLDNCK